MSANKYLWAALVATWCIGGLVHFRADAEAAPSPSEISAQSIVLVDANGNERGGLRVVEPSAAPEFFLTDAALQKRVVITVDHTGPKVRLVGPDGVMQVYIGSTEDGSFSWVTTGWPHGKGAASLYPNGVFVADENGTISTYESAAPKPDRGTPSGAPAVEKP